MRAREAILSEFAGLGMTPCLKEKVHVDVMKKRRRRQPQQPQAEESSRGNGGGVSTGGVQPNPIRLPILHLSFCNCMHVSLRYKSVYRFV